MPQWPVPTLVIGASGLLGSAVVARLSRQGTPVLTQRVRWEHGAGDDDLVRGGERLLAAAAAQQAENRGAEARWALAWCAGAGVTGARVEDLREENRRFQLLLDVLAADAPAGAVLLASSAGGVYAGCGPGPHTEFTAPQPLSAYGEAKLDAEHALRRWATTHGGRGVAVRYANLYGPGQDLAKPQGLVSHLCRGFLTAQPISIYVPIDTLRDYIYAPDAADVTARLLAEPLEPGRLVVKICASGQSVSIGGLIGTCRAVFRRRPRVVMGSSPLSSAQASDLRLRSVVLTHVVPQPQTTLVAGIDATLSGTRMRLFGPRPG